MNREILFRGKWMDNGEWVYGWYCKYAFSKWPLRDCIIPSKQAEAGCIEYIKVDHATVGQYTGLDDKNGVKIFEGDIISYSGSKEVVRFNTSLNIPCFTTGIGGGSSTRLHPYKISKKHVVIGNIHDDPELLEVLDETL